jgi:tripartite-type tricarboxylate transporter receptor subunit TctC
VKVLNEILVKATAMPATKSQLAANGADPVSATPEEFGAYVRAEVEKWAKVVAFSGMKID